MSDTSGIPSTNLELHLEFDGNYDDLSVNNRDQSPRVGAASFTTGAVGQCAKFSYGAQNDIDTGVNALGSADLFCDSGSSDFTIALAVQFKDESAFGTGTLIARQAGTGVAGIANSNLFIHIGSDRRLLVRLRGHDTLYDVALHDGEFHTIVLTWDASDEDANLYVDGVAQVAPAVGSNAENTTNIFIGGSSLPGIPGLPTSNLVGRLDDLRVYSREWTAGEINLYHIYIRPEEAGGGDIQLEDLELWLQYENDLLDSSVHLRHQTANIANGPLAFVAGRVGTLASEWTAGSTQYIATGVQAFGDCDLFSTAGQEFTVAVWVKDIDGSGGIGAVISRRMSSTGFRLQVIVGGANVTLRGQLNNYTLSNSDGEWHHYVVTWDGTDAAFYFDGVAQSVPTNGADTEGTENILIGVVDAVGGGVPANFALHFDEGMDDLRLYSRALAAGDVTELFEGSALDKFGITLQTVSVTDGVITISATMETAVTTFIAADITVVNGTAGTPAGSGTAWTFTVTPDDDGLVTVHVPEDNVTADDDRLNHVSNTLSFVIAGTDDPTNTGLLQFDRTVAPTFAANAIIGPIAISQNACQRSIVQSARHVFGSGTTATGAMNVAVGVDGEDAINKVVANQHHSTTIAAVQANNGMSFPRLGGHAAVLEIDVTTGHLTFEQSTLEVRQGGKNLGRRHGV